MAINKVIMVGRLVATPELKMTQSGIQVVSFSLALSKGKDQPSDFFDFVAWRNNAEFISRYFHKGDGIGVVGRLTVDAYTDKDGNKRKSYKVTADEFFFVEGKRSDVENAQVQSPANTAPTEKTAYSAKYEAIEVSQFEDVGSDEELPF